MRSSTATLLAFSLFAASAGAGEFPANQLFVISQGTNSIVPFKATAAAPFHAPTGANIAGQPVANLAFGPDGRLYASADTAVRAYDADGGPPEIITGGLLSGGSALAFGPGGSLFVVSRLNSLVIEYSNFSGTWQFRRSFPVAASDPRGLAISPDGSLYVSDNDHGKIYEYDLAGTLVRSFSTGNASDKPHGLTFGPFGHLYVAMSSAVVGEVTVTDRVYEFISTGVKVNEFGAGSGLEGPRCVAFGPNGNLFVTSAQDDLVFEFDRVTHAKVAEFGTASVDFPEGLAFVPQRFKAKLTGRLAIDGESVVRDTEKAVISIAPGSRTIMIALKDVDANSDGFFANFFEPALVFHGFETAKDDDARRRLFGGAEVHSFVGGVGAISLCVTGTVDGFGQFVVKGATGSVSRHGASGGFDAEVEIGGALLNAP